MQIIIIFAEISRFIKERSECKSENDRLFYWFKKGWQFSEEPKELEGDSNMKSLMKACDIAGFPPEKLIEYQKQVMNERDARNIIKSAERRGREEGREEERLESARRMLQDNIHVELVSKYCNLSIQEVNSLRAKEDAAAS